MTKPVNTTNSHEFQTKWEHFQLLNAHNQRSSTPGSKKTTSLGYTGIFRNKKWIIIIIDPSQIFQKLWLTVPTKQYQNDCEEVFYKYLYKIGNSFWISLLPKAKRVE